MRFRSFATLFTLVLSAQTALAIDHRVEKLDEAAPADALSPEIAGQLAESGVRVIRGSSRTLCDIWLTKQWPLKSLEAGADLIYPFQPGQLIGVVRFDRKSSDFRDQEIEEGVYTLRYAQQPVDGAHVGTSITIDFLLVVKAEADKSAEPLAYKPLAEKSAAAVQTSHPGLLSLQRVPEEAGDTPSIREDEEKEWWIVRLTGKAAVEGKQSAMPIDLVIVGQATE
ncbi:MAG: hypothetical protein KDA38_07835 [Planctomycetales bacterium]|nr:hypothetical protein [Planctomycetales bacterium]